MFTSEQKSSCRIQHDDQKHTVVDWLTASELDFTNRNQWVRDWVHLANNNPNIQTKTRVFIGLWSAPVIFAVSRLTVAWVIIARI